MRLAAIFNVWSDWDLLEHALKNIRPLVDGVIIVASETSNFGEKHPVPDWPDIYQREPNLRLDPRTSETDKRNFGLGIAREQGYTHYIAMDADEFYESEPFLKAKQYIEEKDLNGLVCQCRTYFKSPQLTIGLDTTLVPFIHKITPTLRHEFNKRYPFAWIDGQIRIDPTRSLNINSGVERIDLEMHHYSWVRSDYQKKIRNSTARRNLERSSILKELLLAKEGYFVEFYQRHLQRSSVDFGIPEFHEHSQHY
jgi:hypothetical protein